MQLLINQLIVHFLINYSIIYSIINQLINCSFISKLFNYLFAKGSQMYHKKIHKGLTKDRIRIRIGLG